MYYITFLCFIEKYNTNLDKLYLNNSNLLYLFVLNIK